MAQIWIVSSQSFYPGTCCYFLGKSLVRLTTQPDEFCAKFSSEAEAQAAADAANKRTWKTRLYNKFMVGRLVS